MAATLVVAAAEVSEGTFTTFVTVLWVTSGNEVSLVGMDGGSDVVVGAVSDVTDPVEEAVVNTEVNTDEMVAMLVALVLVVESVEVGLTTVSKDLKKYREKMDIQGRHRGGRRQAERSAIHSANDTLTL